MRLAPALIACVLLLPNLASADDCSFDDTNLTLTARATQQSGMWQIQISLSQSGGPLFDASGSTAHIDVYAAGTRVQRIPVRDVFERADYSASFPVDDYVNRARVEFYLDPASRNDTQYFNHDCNPADDVVNLRLN